MTFSALIVDDEPPAARVLEKYIAKVPVLTLAGTASDALEAGALLRERPVELLFLDIHLPELSGISFLRTLTAPPLVIFTTAYPEYALTGYELAAVDYLVKPIPFERFLLAVNKAVEILVKQHRLQQLEQEKGGVVQHLAVRADRKLYRLDLSDILYLQAYGDYVKIVTRQGNITPKCTLQELENQLPHPAFLRVHRSYIVSLAAIRYLEGNHLGIGDALVPLGQSYRQELLEHLEGKEGPH